MRALDRADALPAARAALEQFIGEHPGDPTAISAGLLYVIAEEALLG
jgi:hypothetical protein